MSVANDTFWRPGNHVLGAGVLYFCEGQGKPERPIIETDSLTLNVEVETLERTDSVDGPRGVVDSEIVSVRRTLGFGTTDYRDENLNLYFGASVDTQVDFIEHEAFSAAAPSVGDWFQVTPHPMPFVPLAVYDNTGGDSTPVTIVEGVDYVLDRERGRIQVLNGELTAIGVTYSTDVVLNVATSQPEKAVRGALRFLADPTTGQGSDLWIPKVSLRPASPLELKSRSEWTRVGLEAEVMGEIIRVSGVEETVSIDFSIYEGNDQDVEIVVTDETTGDSVDFTGYSELAFNAHIRGTPSPLAIELSSTDGSPQVSGDANGKITVELSSTDTDLTPGVYLYEFLVDEDGSTPLTVKQGFFRIIDSAFA